jgi:Bacterial Alpha-2-macroglobulin MG10 domain
LSNLQTNTELKSVLLEETPWVLAGKSEEEQKKNIALLFDLARMNRELSGTLERLQQMQAPDGSFSWFPGGPGDRYITQYILSGIGHLIKLTGTNIETQDGLNSLAGPALGYLDQKMKQDYEQMQKNKSTSPDYLSIQYLYTRSFFSKIPLTMGCETAYQFFRKQATLAWTHEPLYLQGMIALAAARTGDSKTARNIVQSLKERAISDPELGMYWKSLDGGWFWYQAPIETQALLIEVFAEVTHDTKAVEDMKTWLLKNKQTNNWRTTRATAEACYALLLQGASWTSMEPIVKIQLGKLTFTDADASVEGAGYMKTTIPGDKIEPDMGKISVEVTGASGQGASLPTWGAAYWQYFEDADQVSASATPLRLTKKLFVEKNTDRGPVLSPVAANDELHPGDKIKVRIEIHTDRDLEYVHMKDMRAAALEPVDVLSGYKWQDGLGYYQTTRDASTQFFFDHLRKGTYVFEYSLFVATPGNFSNGITTIQCMYAPEFTAHSEGTRITVTE